MTPIEIVLSDTGFVFDPAQPTKETERLSYMLANGLDGKTMSVAALTTTELTDRFDRMEKIIRQMADGDNEENLENFMTALCQVKDGVQSIQSTLNYLFSREDPDTHETVPLSEDIGVRNQEAIVEAIQDVAGASGVLIDCPAGEVSVIRVESPEQP